MLLHGERRAERRRQLVRARAGVGHQSLRDRIAALRAADADREIAQLQLDAARERFGPDRAEQVHRERAQRHAKVEEWAARLCDTYTDPVDREGGHERERAGVEEAEREPAAG